MPSNRSRSMLRVAPHTQVGSGGPVTASFKQGEDGAAQVSISLDYSKAVPPEFSYVADHCSVSKDIAAYSILFGKMDSGRKNLRTRIEIVFPSNMFHQQLLATTIGFVSRMPPDIDVPDLDARDFPDPEKFQTFRSNNVMVGAWGDEGVADFHFLSPADFGMAAQNQVSEIRLNPVVRVTMSAALLKDFLTKCHQFAKEPVKKVDV